MLSEHLRSHRPEQWQHPHVPGHLLLKFSNGVSEDTSEVKEILSRHGAVCAQTHEHIEVHLYDLDGADTEPLARELIGGGWVEFAEPNNTGNANRGTLHLIPNDTNYSSQWHLAKINLPIALDITFGSPTILVADIDTGYNVNPDSPSNIVAGYNFALNNTDTSDSSSIGHGSLVMNVMAELANNGSTGPGLAGIASGVSFMPLRITDNSDGIQVNNVVRAVNYAVNNGVLEINIPLGFNGTSATMQSAVNYAVAQNVSICAAGPESPNDSSANIYPFNCTGVIGVTATDSSDNIASFAIAGPPYPTISAPGVSITIMDKNGNSATVSGTSVAVPCTTATRAMIRSVSPGLSVAGVTRILKSTAALASGQTVQPDNTYGWGRIDLGAAATMAKNSTLFWTLFDNFRKNQETDLALNLATGGAHVKCALITSATQPNTATDTTWPGSYTEVSGTDYTAGGIDISSGQSIALSGGTVTYTTTTQILWHSSPSGFSNAQYAVLYDSGTNRLIGWGSFGGNFGNTTGDLVLSLASAGIILSP